MPEGDTLARIAIALRPYLAGRVVTNARARLPGPQVSLIVGQKIDAVEAAGKNLLIKFDGGLELRTHLGLHGSWHRYRPGETWRRPPSRAALVIEVPGAVAVCFDAPVVELFERRAEQVHPTISMLGPDLLAPNYDQAEAIRRLRDKSRAEMPIGEAILDQRAVAGVGNVFKSEVLYIEKVDPFAPVATLDEATLNRFMVLGHAPDPDLFIRTGGEIRISNFLLWQIAYSELVFSDCLWPEFGEADLDAAIAEYAQRDRRFGAVQSAQTASALGNG